MFDVHHQAIEMNALVEHDPPRTKSISDVQNVIFLLSMLTQSGSIAFTFVVVL